MNHAAATASATPKAARQRGASRTESPRPPPAGDQRTHEVAALADKVSGVYAAIYDRLKSGGRFASAEISGDLDAPEFPVMLEDWKRVQTLMGATPQSLANLGGMMREALGVLPPEETQALWRAAGFTMPIPFFQALMIRGWHAVR